MIKQIYNQPYVQQYKYINIYNPLKKFQCRYNAVEDKGVEFCIDTRNWDLEVIEPILMNSGV